MLDFIYKIINNRVNIIRLGNEKKTSYHLVSHIHTIVQNSIFDIFLGKYVFI